MAPQSYRHQIIRWNGDRQQLGKYQLQIIAIDHDGNPLHRAEWNFETFRGLLTFLKTYFPDSDYLEKINRLPIQFRLASTLSNA